MALDHRLLTALGVHDRWVCRWRESLGTGLGVKKIQKPGSRVHTRDLPAHKDGMRATQKIRPDDTLLTPAQVAERLGVSTGTLANWRSAGSGPPWFKPGRIRYPERHLAEWLTAQRGGAA